MTSPVQPVDAQAWATGLRACAVRRRTPLSGILELTSRCNLRCRHCYLGDRVGGDSEAERGTAEVLASLDEWAAAGCFFLLITGGDPMFRRDFSEVYRHARELGMLVTVFCNGTLITDTHLELFREYPPRRVEISLYGATEQTHDAITRVPGSHARAWAGIRRLLAAGVPLRLKTIMMSLNRHEMAAMEEQARELDVPFYYDAAVTSRLDGTDNGVENLRVAPREVVAHDLATPERRQHWRDRIARFAAQPESDDLYTCAAGASMFYADAQGRLSPCLMTTRYRFSLQGRTFREVWETDLAGIRARKRTGAGDISGDLRGACNQCPALNFMETGYEEKDSEYLQETARLRYSETVKMSGEDHT